MIRTRLSTRTRRGCPGIRSAATAAGRVLGAALVLALAPRAAHAQDAAADTVQIVNTARVTWTAGGVTAAEVAVSAVPLARTAGAALAPPREAAVFPGERRVLAHVLENRGNGADRFTLSASGPAGWTLAVHLDANGDGALDAGDPRASGPVALAAGASAPVLLVVDAPAGAPEGEVEVALAAASGNNPAATARVVDRLTVRHPVAALRLAKTVDLAEAARGDTLAYALAWSNQGEAAAAGAVVRDTLPAGLRYVAGSLRVDGAAVTDAPDADAGSVSRTQDGRDVVRINPGTLAPGAEGAATFRAAVAAEAVGLGTLTNVAVLTAGDASVRSAPVSTGIGVPVLEIAKERLGADTVDAGAQVVYRVTVANRSTAFGARGVVVTDTLPQALAFVSASAAVETEGQVVRWRIGQLAPRQAVSLEIAVRAGASDAAVVNRAHVRATNAPDGTAQAAPLAVRSFTGTELELAKTAGVLEASLGEAVGYTLTLRNRGGIPLRSLVVTDLLPAGTRLVEAGVTGADSVRVSGREAVFYVAGPLAPGAEHHVRYALVVLTAPADRTPLANRAWGTAEGARVRSDTAVAWVRLRGGQPVASRALLGKVWLDRDGDGRQGPGEPGVRGVEVWSAAGEMVTTDAEGRFSFPDLRAGAHVVRLDTLSLPAGMRLAAAADGVQRARVDGWTLPVLSFRLLPGAGTAPSPQGADTALATASVPTVPALRTAEEREAEAARAFVEGPAIRITAPADGSVAAGNRVYVGLKGEPGALARLYDGERLVGEATLRPDGSWDFVGVPLTPGPHRLRAWMRSSWGHERWDSVAVHRSGAAAVLEGPSSPVVLRADARATVGVPVRVLDEWGVPVTDGPMGGAEARGARLAAADADSGSLGWQAKAGPDGTLLIPLRGGDTVGSGELLVSVGQARLRVPLTILPTERPLIATGAVQVGVGAAPAAHGALSVRGAVGARTAVTVSYDSRRGDADTEFFAGGYDLRDEGRYPTLGDNSERRAAGSATQALSARVEHGLDWVALGDVETAGFSGSDRLGGYRRALTGAAARLGTGPVVWRAFGSYTDQALREDQLRANGGSGPYRFGGPVRPGTERVAVEVRAKENAARLVRREELARSVDYQIDYRTGEVLLQRPLPSEDAYGNPVFLVAVLERRAGEREMVGGMRMELDAGGLLARRAVGDSLGLAVFGVHDGAGAGLAEGGAARLFGAEVQVRRGGLAGVAEVLRSDHADSASVAGQARVQWTLPGERVRLEGAWLRVGDGFASTLNPRLRSGLEEWSVGTELRVGERGRLRLRHERQNFRAFGVERQSTMVTAERTVAGRRLTAEGGVQADAAQSGEAAQALGRATLALDRRTDVWVEGTRGLSQRGAMPARPDHLGVGVGHRVLPWARVEGHQRWVRVQRDSSLYTVSGLNVRTDLPLGTRIWTGVERTAAEGATHAAVLGWNQQLALWSGWQFHTLLERRFGIDRAPLADPVRALPFAQPERDRWSAGWGLEYLPPRGARFAARHELRGGDAQGWRFDLGGELPAGRSLALLTRHDWWAETRPDAGVETRRDRSLLGLALRPAGRQDVNVLSKLEYRHTANPLAGTVLSGAQEEWRLIGATDAVWTPRPGLELAGRWALRRTVAEDSAAGGQRLRSTAHYLGGRVEQDVHRGVGLRLDGRLLSERVTGESRWSAAPSLAVGLGGGLEVEGGWRFGDLLDPDFAAWGRNGAFAVLSLRFTEGSLHDAAAFWRGRIARD